MPDKTIDVNSSKYLIEKKSERWLALYTIVLAFLTFTHNPFAVPFALLMILVFAFNNKYLALAAYVSTLIINPPFTVATVFVSLLEVSAIGVSLMKRFSKNLMTMFVLTSLFILLMLIGMAVGAESKLETILLFGFNLYLVVFIAQMIIEQDEKLIIGALLFSGLAIAIYVGYNFLTGNVDEFLSSQGRLGYQENAKTLAASVVIPVFLALNKFFKREERKNRGELLFYIVVFAICFPVLLLTYARGVMIAFAAAVLVLMITNSGRFKFYHFLIYAIVAVAMGFIIVRLEMNASLWFDNLEGGNGRTGIYRMYYNYMVQKGRSAIIWGLGTANFKDIIGWYPHSVFFAYFFHFGIWGAIFVAYEIIVTLVGLFRKRKDLGFYLSLFTLVLVMFSAHGSYNTPLYYVILGLCYGMVNKKINKKELR